MGIIGGIGVPELAVLVLIPLAICAAAAGLIRGLAKRRGLDGVFSSFGIFFMCLFLTPFFPD